VDIYNAHGAGDVPATVRVQSPIDGHLVDLGTSTDVNDHPSFAAIDEVFSDSNAVEFITIDLAVGTCGCGGEAACVRVMASGAGIGPDLRSAEGAASLHFDERDARSLRDQLTALLDGTTP